MDTVVIVDNLFRKFWTRNRPGDEMRDRYNLNNLPTGVEQEILEYSSEFPQHYMHRNWPSQYFISSVFCCHATLCF